MKPRQRKNVSVKTLAQLERVNLPSDEWKLMRAEIKFERRGVLGEWASVVWDSGNNVFYVSTNKCIVYPDDQKALNEAMALMNKVNKIVNENN